MAHFHLSYLSRSCLLALGVGTAPAALAESPWKVTDGTRLEVTSGYVSNTARDYPLFASGNGSLLESSVNGLNFRTTGNTLHAAYATGGGAINLSNATLATNGTLAHGANILGGSLQLNGGAISVAGSNSAGVFGSNGANLSLANLAIAADGEASSGVTLTTGTLNASNTTIVGSGNGSRGIALAYSTAGEASAQLDNVNILLRGEGTQAGIMLGNGRVNGNNVNISTTGRNRGVDIYNSSGGHGSLTLNNSSISSQNGDAVYILGGDVTLNNVTATTTGGMALNVNKTAQATVRGGSFATSGANADAVWIATADSSADVAGASFTTQGNTSHAFNAQYGNARLADSTLTTAGQGSYGLYTEAEVQGDNLQITTQGDRGIGVYAARGGTINLDRAAVNTHGNGSAALLAYPGSTINGNALSVVTAGEDSHALWARGGVLNISNSVLTAQGKNAAGLYISNTPTGDGSSVTLDNVTMSSGAGPAIKTNGAALELWLKNGTTVSGGNGVLLENLAGNLSDPHYSGDVTLNADNQVLLHGDILAAKENRVEVALSNASHLTGAVSQVDSLRLDASSGWNLTGNSTLGQLHNDGQVAFRHDGKGFSTLSLDTLSGNGTFAMNTDLAALRGDLIAVGGEAHGDHLLAIKNSGREPGKTDEALTVVTTGGGNAGFALNGGAVDAGTYQYELQQRGNDWVLAQKHNDDGSPVPTPSTLSALGLFNAIPTAWYGELTTLRTRMGEVREGKQQGGVWARMIGNQYQVSSSAGVGYRQNQSGISLGVDSAHSIDGGQLLTGLFSGVSRSALDFNRGSSGTINSFFVGGYGTWLLESGWFIDAVAKANNFSSQADVRMTDGEKAHGGYNVPGLGLSLEVGRKLPLADGWFVEPSAQLSSLWVKGQSYRFSNGLLADSGSATSHQAALNGVLGKSVTLENGMVLQPWLRLAAVQEFADSNAVSINGNRFNNDLSGTRGEVGAGVSLQLSQDLQLYSDARYSKGDKIESPWGASMGVRWSW